MMISHTQGPSLALLLLLGLVTAVAAGAAPSRFTEKKYKTIGGRRMAYVEVGAGDPIVFLHGNPTSSYLWRNVMPHLEGRGRLIAPDLIGLGDSDKLPPGDPLRYSMLNHANYLFQLLEALHVKTRVTLVIHDWGSALGFLWAFQRRFDPSAIRGVAFMEAVVTPFRAPDFPLNANLVPIFSQLRGPAGEKLILQDNYFITTLLPGGILRNLTAAEKAEYNRPFVNAGEDRRALLTFPRQVPIDGMPSSTTRFVGEYAEWLPTANFPKLFIRATFGVLITGPFTDFVRTWSNLTEIVVDGIHYVQEDSPDKIGRSIATWLPK